jgi:chaperone modulatory protein CbpM
MMFSTAEFLERAQLDQATLEIWIEEEWILPVPEAADRRFSEVDLARVQLIRDLMDDMGVNAEGVGIVLRLVDQVHGLRRALAEVAAASKAR